ncbi:MAG: thiamine-phosphate kinase [Bacteroidales bacterium]|jgi:thiamine-monophosphate kinase|nr:thiamine-phosphate kinase [Bacteroidales bacterium]
MNKRTELSELGEFGVIERLTKSQQQTTNISTLMGVGDDCAAIMYDGKVTLVSSDCLVEGVHFDMAYTPLKHLGYKAATVNFSDIYACNGQPTQLLISLAVSNRYCVEALDELYEGLHLACQRYGVDLVGGDMASSNSGMFLSLTALGQCDKESMVRRSGAKVHDLICVSGNLGAAYAGLLVLQREKAVFLANPNSQPDLSDYQYVIERHLKPEAQKDIVKWLSDNAVLPTAMIDISDGLASETLHICKQSNVGCELYLDKLPVDYEASRTLEEFHILPDTGALNGGEDYELLFTINQNDYSKIQTNKDISVIGHITDSSCGCNLVTPQNTTIELKARGFNHYNREV